MNSAFFRASFLCRLPREIRVLLADEVRGDLKDMAVRADELFQHHRPNVVAAVDMAVDEDLAEAVAALDVRANKGGFRGKKKEAPRSGGSGNSGGSGSSGGGSSSGGKSYFICDRHWKYGAKAFQCDAPNKCQWKVEN